MHTSTSDSLPPAGNTGGNQTLNQKQQGHGVKLDYLRGTFPRPRLDSLLTLLEPIFGKGHRAALGVSGYTSRIDLPTPGLFLAWSDDRPEALLNVPGKALDLLGASGCWDLLQFLRVVEFRPTRLDVAFDDFDGLIPMPEVHAAGQAGNFLGFRKYRTNREFSGGVLSGDTAYFGSRGENGAGRFVRFYNKTMETGGESSGLHHDHTRFEVEFSGELARELWVDLTAAADVENLTRVIAHALGGAITFADRQGQRNGNTSRFERAGWWVKVVEILGAVKYRVQRQKPVIQQQIEWFKKQVSGTAAKIRAAVQNQYGLGRQFLNAILDDVAIDLAALAGPENQVPKWMVERELEAAGREPFRAARRLSLG